MEKRAGVQMKNRVLTLLSAIPAVLYVVVLSGCPGSKTEKCSWGAVCPSSEVCHDPTEQCVLPRQISACTEKVDYEPCSYTGSVPGTVCRKGICVIPHCGDSIADPDEECDGMDLKGETCESLGFGEGNLGCSSNCRYDTRDCELGSVCGDDKREGSEVCDGEDLAGETCITQGFYAGVLACLEDCSDFNTSGCVGYCGDAVINGPEECDGLNLGGATCDTLGFYGGELACLPDCTGFDTSGCNNCPEGSVYISAGDFEMGCNEDDPCYIYASESPRHTVTLSAYCIQVTEVSVAQYRECKDGGGCPTGAPVHTGNDTDSWFNWTSGAGEREEHPINGIRWNDAREYCNWKGGDLPTEAQWEKAARGTDQRTYPWGEEDPSCDRCNWNQSGFSVPYGCNDALVGPGTWPVGFLTATDGDSPYGLKDMAGNVSEWTLDCYGPNFYSTCVEGCEDPANNVEGCTGERVIRGGSFTNDLLWQFRVVTRLHMEGTSLSASVGFRCVFPPAE